MNQTNTASHSIPFDTTTERTYTEQEVEALLSKA